MLERTKCSTSSLDTKVVLPAHHNIVRNYEQHMEWHLRWFLAIFLATWTLVSIAVPIILWSLTKNPSTFTAGVGIAPVVGLWYKLANYSFGVYEKEFRVDMAIIEHEERARENPQANDHD